MDDRIMRALITGASAGLGACFARQLAAQGVEVVLVARREERLRELAATLPGAPEVVVADLADHADRTRVEDRLTAASQPIDLLVNNAGFGAYGPVAELDLERQAAMVELNVTTLTRLTRTVLPQLLERGVGGVINVGSTAGFQPSPHGAVYAATKAYVRSFTEAVHEELRGTEVTVSLLAPGFTLTEFQDVAGVADGAVPDQIATDADRVVAEGLAAFAAGRAVCVPGRVNKLNAVGSQVTPSAVSRRLSGLAHRRLAGR